LEDNIKIYPTESVEDVDWINLAEDSDICERGNWPAGFI